MRYLILIVITFFSFSFAMSGYSFACTRNSDGTWTPCPGANPPKHKHGH